MHSHTQINYKSVFKPWYLIYIILPALCWWGCIKEAEHDNPLDPANGVQRYKLNGRVLTYYYPQQPLANAIIEINPGKLITVTDANGEYRLANLDPGTYQIICYLQGYHRDTTDIELTNELVQDFYLDGLPEFNKISISAHHLSRWFPREEFYFLSLETDVGDPDGLGDIHSVSFTIPALNFSDTLQPAIRGGLFTGNLFDSDLPVTSIHELIGHELVFLVNDDYGITTSTGGQYLTRIIEETPVLRAPVELKTIEVFPLVFEWERVFVPYPASLRIELFQISFGVAIKIDQVDNIELSAKSLSYEKILAASDYFWTLHIVDEFGNSSGSKEGTFRIH